MGATVPAGGDLRDGRRRCPRSGAAAGGETTAMGEGRASSCSPRAELGDVSDWFPMLGMFSSSSPPAPILPFARVLDLLPKGVDGARKATTSPPDQIATYIEAKVWVGATTDHPLVELDVGVSEGAEHGCCGVKHGGH